MNERQTEKNEPKSERIKERKAEKAIVKYGKKKKIKN